MNPLVTPQGAANALHSLAEAPVDRAADIQQHSGEDEWSASDDESDSACPIIDAFYSEAGPPMFLHMTNFTAQQFNLLW